MKYAEGKNRYIQILVLLLIGTGVYLFSGQEWMVLEKDSYTYLNATIGNIGVMPVYPFFLSVLKYFFGENLYLDAAVVIQSVIAILCTVIFVLYLQSVFRLRFLEMILFYIAAMLPYAIDLPKVCVTHQLITESLAFSLFYIYFICLMQYVLFKKRKWLFVTLGMVVLMALTRSQLIFLFIVTAVFFVGTEFAGEWKVKGIKKWLKAGRNFLLSIVAAYLLVLVVYQLREGYVVYVHPAINNRNQEVSASESNSEEKANASAVDSEKVKNQKKVSQMTHLIIIRGFYQADEEDIALFDTPEMQEIFQRVYDEVDKREFRYEYAEPGLYMWKDLVKDKIPGAAGEAINHYLTENPDAEIDKEKVMRELGMKVLLKHFDRYLYHSVRLMIVGFISSVFFQIEKIYLLCHFITLFLFVLTIVCMLYCMKYNGEKKVVAFAGATVGFICMLVAVITFVFVPLQRYMVYAMGIFYCSLYLLMKESLLITAERFPDNRLLALAVNILDGQADQRNSNP
ncbi:MAG: hypothetical protein K2O59_07510 [Lachnospiraceae bacterium]|nr:hypothetical protein [Lachnospiraceae bacterium]